MSANTKIPADETLAKWSAIARRAGATSAPADTPEGGADWVRQQIERIEYRAQYQERVWNARATAAREMLKNVFQQY